MEWSTAFDILAIVAIVVAALLTPFGIYRVAVLFPRWRMASRLYGQGHWSVGFDVYQFSKFGRLATFRLFAALGLVASMLPLVGEAVYASTQYRHVWDNGEWHWIAWLALWLSYAVVWFAVECELAIPPAVLLLGPSSAELERTLGKLNRELPGCRTLALLRPGAARLSGRARWSVYANNLRTRDTYQWRSIVFQLMDVVPVIVLCDDMAEPVAVAHRGMDQRPPPAPDSPVVEESRRIARHGYRDRTFDTTLTRLSDSAEQRRLMEWLTVRLATVNDQTARAERQQTFNAMRRTLPSRLRYPRSVEGFVERAARLLGLGQYRFLKLCKKLDRQPTETGLLEDLPSAVSREGELRFLREDRVFEEMDILFDSVEEAILRRSREQETYLRESAVKREQFNARMGSGGALAGMFDRVERAVEWARRRLRLKVGNLTVKRGQLARYRGEWGQAKQILEQAIDQLIPLSLDPDPGIEREALCELGTAYFYLGDIALARHRETPDPHLLREAAARYRVSVQYDERGGGETAHAKRRLAMLPPGPTV